MIDADCFYLQDPGFLFTDSGYIEKGSILFKDRTEKPRFKTTDWLKSFIKNPLPETKENRILKGVSYFEIESSTVVINKIKSFLGLLNICKLNEKDIRSKIVYKMVCGDKETFWLGFEMSRQNYYVNQEYTAAVGEIIIEKNGKKKFVKKICGNNGNIGHTWNGELLFWNGHLMKDHNKNIKIKGIYTSYFIVKDGINRWREYKDQKQCFTLSDNQEAISFNINQKKIISKVEYK